MDAPDLLLIVSFRLRTVMRRCEIRLSTRAGASGGEDGEISEGEERDGFAGHVGALSVDARDP